MPCATHEQNAVIVHMRFCCCVTGLMDSSSKVQISAVNMLNLALSLPDLEPQLAGLLCQEQGLLPAVMALLDHSLPLLRAKAIISIVLLCRYCLPCRCTSRIQSDCKPCFVLSCMVSL